MAIQSYIDEFKQNYEKPQVDGLIVGFSGIDPQRKSSGSSGSGSSCNCDNSILSDAQKEIVLNLIHEALSVIDFSECNCDPTQLSDEQKDIITRIIEQKIEQINITLSNEQKEIVKETIDDRLRELDFCYDAGVIDNNNDNQTNYEPVNENNLDHEKLQNLLGGDNDGHFHLNSYEINKLRILINTFFLNGSDEVIIKPKLLNS